MSGGLSQLRTELCGQTQGLNSASASIRGHTRNLRHWISDLYTFQKTRTEPLRRKPEKSSPEESSSPLSAH